MSNVLTPTDPRISRLYRPHGAARDLLLDKRREIMLSGPAGTGKSRACLEKLHLCALKYAGMRGLIVRKSRASLSQTGLVTYEDKVLPEGSAICQGVQRRMRQSYRYPNGSELIVGGLDDVTKIMSSEYDMIYVQEAIEAEEDDWEKLTTRLRNGVMPYQQIIGDTNPDAPTHWLKSREAGGQTAFYESRHEDNPTLWDAVEGAWTAAGRLYIATLDALTGTRYARLRKGQWVSAEGQIYEGWDRKTHLLPADSVIPPTWPRVWVFDFGYKNPFVWQDWATDPDGRLYLVREIYRTGRLVEDHARDIAALQLVSNAPRPTRLICDHDAEDRATLEKHLGMTTTAAKKDVSPGIQAVMQRLKVQPDGKPRLYVLSNALVELDTSLLDAKKPTCTAQEFDGYVWDTRQGRSRGESPLKEDDHGCDATRYRVADADMRLPQKPSRRGTGGGFL